MNYNILHKCTFFFLICYTRAPFWPLFIPIIVPKLSKKSPDIVVGAFCRVIIERV